MRHRSLRQRARTLHRALLHCRHTVRGLRSGNDFPVSLGGEVQVSGVLGADGDAGLPRHPDCRVLMDREEGSARMGLTATGPNPPAPGAAASDETFSASRWTKGNLWFPTRIVVSPLRVSRVKRRLFSRSEESVSISQVASVKISTGIFWSDILIESTAGTDPITSHGHRKADAVPIRDLIERFQALRR